MDWKKYLVKNGYRRIPITDKYSSFVNIEKGFAFQLKNTDFDKFILHESPKMKSLFESELGTQNNGGFHIQWHITNNCNLRCKHCYQKKYDSNELPLKKLKSIANELLIFTKQFSFEPEFSLTGGEPLVSRSLFTLAEHIRLISPRARLSIMTNGTLLTKSIVKRFKELNIDMVQLSLESSEQKVNDFIRGKGVYDKVLKAIKLLKKYCVKCSLHFVASKYNANDAENYFKLAVKLGVNRVTFSNLVPIGNGFKISDQVLEPLELKNVYSNIVFLAKKNPKICLTTTRPLWCLLGEKGGYCPVGLSTITILPDGKLVPCRRLQVEVGNLTKQSFLDAWFGSKVLWDLRDTKKIKVCGTCKHKENCKGCRGLAHAIRGDYLAPDPQCWKINKKLRWKNDLS